MASRFSSKMRGIVQEVKKAGFLLKLGQVGIEMPPLPSMVGYGIAPFTSTIRFNNSDFTGIYEEANHSQGDPKSQI